MHPDEDSLLWFRDEMDRGVHVVRQFSWQSGEERNSPLRYRCHHLQDLVLPLCPGGHEWVSTEKTFLFSNWLLSVRLRNCSRFSLLFLHLSHWCAYACQCYECVCVCVCVCGACLCCRVCVCVCVCEWEQASSLKEMDELIKKRTCVACVAMHCPADRFCSRFLLVWSLLVPSLQYRCKLLYPQPFLRIGFCLIRINCHKEYCTVAASNELDNMLMVIWTHKRQELW